MRVFVLDKDRRPLDPCHPARARKLLNAGRAAVFRRFPFTIILKDRELANSVVHPHRVKFDPGSRTTGVALLNDDTSTVVFGAEIEHRGAQIHLRMTARASLRRARRNRKTRYRAPQFLNRNPAPCIVCDKNARHGHKTCRLHAGVRPETPAAPRRLPPSLESRVANVETWARRLIRLAPVAAISMELVRFDLQNLENPEIQGVEYQQGELAGYEVKEYLLLKFGHQCAYCGGLSKDPVLELEPRNRLPHLQSDEGEAHARGVGAGAQGFPDGDRPRPHRQLRQGAGAVEGAAQGRRCGKRNALGALASTLRARLAP